MIPINSETQIPRASDRIKNKSKNLAIPPKTMAILSDNKDSDDEERVPVIDLSNPNRSEIVSEISLACRSWGFFQIVNHGVSPEEMEAFRSAMKSFFDLPEATKNRLRRNESNARGYFDDELTKQKRDWKEAFDMGVPGSGDWSIPDDDESNACLDGYNRFPSSNDLPNFRETMVRYFETCHKLSDVLANYMSLGLGVEENDNHHNNNGLTTRELYKNHTSYLRMNHYPPCSPSQQAEQNNPLGISPHTDAGFLTVLIQDDGCHSLQVAKHRSTNDNLGSGLVWKTVEPVPGAFTINTGDMCCIWSNGKYKPPLHRVLCNSSKQRYSAPFFYNPPYQTAITPLLKLNNNKDTTTLSDDSKQQEDEIEEEEPSKYEHPCVWGYFRAVRFAGDLTDLGTEIQISDYATGSTSTNPRKQTRFLQQADFHAPFSVEKYRPLLVENDEKEEQ